MDQVQNINSSIDSVFAGIPANLLPVVLFLILWSLVWKGFSLWKSARNGSVNWFIALLLINSIGILDILYIFVFSKRNNKDKEVA